MPRSNQEKKSLLPSLNPCGKETYMGSGKNIEIDPDVRMRFEAFVRAAKDKGGRPITQKWALTTILYWFMDRKFSEMVDILDATAKTRLKAGRRRGWHPKDATAEATARHLDALKRSTGVHPPAQKDMGRPTGAAG